MPVMINRNAPYSGVANIMAMRGRHGDTELVHMSKPEVRGLASLGKLTINPETGLPEAFSLKSLIPAAAGVAGSVLFPALLPAGSALATGFLGSAIGGGIGSTLGGLAIGKSPGDALLGGAMAFGAGAIMGGLSGMEAMAPAGGGPGGGLYPFSPGPLETTANLPEPFIPTPSGTPTLGAAQGLQQQDFTAARAIPASKGFLGFGQQPAVAPGESLTREVVLSRGFQPTDITIGERAGQVLSKPSTYAGAGLQTLMAQEPAEYPQLTVPRPSGTEIQPYRLSGGEPVSGTPKTASEILQEQLEGGYTRRLTPYTYTPVQVKRGGLVALQQGGTPQQPSAMSAMLQPQQQFIPAVQQPVQQQQPVSVQVQPVVQQPPASQPTNIPAPEGIKPFDPMNQYRQTYLEMEQERNRKSAEGIVQQASMLGSLAQQVMQQDQAAKGVIPQMPYVPPANYGSQVNMGTTGFNTGGLINLNRGGNPDYFEGQVSTNNGDGMSDEVLFDVHGRKPDMALLSRDEYVLPADVVAMIGNGSSNAGADKLDDFVKTFRTKASGTSKQQKQMDSGKGLKTLM